MENNQKWYEKYRKQLLMGFAALATLVLIIGLMLAWFFGNMTASTVGKIKAPAEISILGPNETYMEQIDLSYDKSEVKDGTVTLKRPFCVRSPSSTFELYIAHTTNIGDLQIKLYEAEVLESRTGADVNGIDSEGRPYYWKKNGESLFTKDKYLNLDNQDSSDTLATNQLHDQVFGTYDNVQDNAEPLYWFSTMTGNQKDDETYLANYILELSWTEVEKETDIIYLIARNTI